MRRRNFLASAAVAGMAGGLGIRQRTLSQKALDLDSLLNVTEVPSIAIAGVIAGKPYQRFAGVRSTGDRSPVSIETRCPALSLSKPVFAAAVHELVRQEKLDWSKPLQDYLDLGLTGDAKAITAAHVLTHSTGLPNWRFQPNVQLASAFAPGSRWQYSGEGIFLLQRVVEKIVNVPIATYMQQAVLAPLGMTSSTYAWTPELLRNGTLGHDRHGAPLERSMVFYEQRNYDTLQKAGVKPESSTYEQIFAAYEKAKVVPLTTAMSPNMAGSLWTTAADYAKFLIKTMADIQTRRDEYLPRVEVNQQIAWTLGWGVDRSANRAAWFHWGDGPGYKNFAWIEPEKKTALAFFTNGDHGLQTYSAAFRTIVGEDPLSLSWL